MTREQYLQHRNNNQMSYELFWEYYQNNCDNPLITDFQTFIQTFSYFNNIFPVLKYDNIFEYYDNKDSNTHQTKRTNNTNTTANTNTNTHTNTKTNTNTHNANTNHYSC